MTQRTKSGGFSAPVLLLTVLALLIAAYIGGWFFARAQLTKGVEQQIEAMRADGYQITWTDTLTEGFPFRLDVVLTDLAVASPPHSSPWTWAADGLRIRLAPPAITRLEVRPEGPQTINPHIAAPFELAAEQPRVLVSVNHRGISAVALESGAWTAVQLGSRDELARGEGVSGEIKRVNDAVGRHDISASVGQLLHGGLDGEPVNMGLNATLLSGDVLAAMGDLTPTSLAAWSSADGALDIARAGVDWGEEALEISGQLAIADNGHWDGALRLTARRPGDVVLRLAELGLIDPNYVNTIRAAADAAAGDSDEMSAPFRVREGALYFMGFPVGRVAPAF